MSEDRKRILAMLAEGKISAEEADTLLSALEARGDAPAGSVIKGDPTPLLEALPRYLYVKVDSQEGDNVDVKVPLALVRSGLKLTSLIPPEAMTEINRSMSEHGMSFDFTNFKPEDIDELIGALREMEITVNGKDGETVRVYCE